MIGVKFKPWGYFEVYRDRDATYAFLKDVSRTGKKTFAKNILTGPKSGRMYGTHQASAAGEFPASMSGLLARSVRGVARPTSASIGSTAPYSGYLADGTSKMAARSMSKEVMKIVVPEAWARKNRWVYWIR